MPYQSMNHAQELPTHDIIINSCELHHCKCTQEGDGDFGTGRLCLDVQPLDFQVPFLG